MKLNRDLKRVIEEGLKIKNFSSLSALASWDQETYMPKDGILPRSELISFIAQERHRIFTGKKLLDSLETLLKNSSLSKEEEAIVKRFHEDIMKEKKLGKSFVKKFSKETSLASETWKNAHKKDNFKKFLPSLKKVISLCQKKADLLGYHDHPYDALVDLYEPGMTKKQLDVIFGEVKPKLISLLKKITAKNKGIHTPPIEGLFSKDLQKMLSNDVIKRIGIHPDQYNLSETHHPFCSDLHPNDIRITTHYDKKDLLKSFTASIHEAGHALYENNLPIKYYGTPLAEAASMSVHESQSRIFETCIGNSRPFWKFYYPMFQQTFPESLKNISMDSFVNNIREIKPSLIRIFSDEVTYCLHIILRYEIEIGLIEESISPKDIPSIWKAKMQEYLGVFPPSDATGCLQDIHWSLGYFGYFPTYALGSMYAGSLFTKYIKSHVDWATDIAAGNFSSFSNFLKERIHTKGRMYLPLQLIEKATEKPFSPHDYLSYLEHRYL